jgi:hypothetical protein
MDIWQQAMLGIGLAACAGLRAWLPLLAIGLLARSGYVPLDASLDFLKTDTALITMSIATVVEFAADKIVVLDNLLDSVSTVIRPLAGAALAAGMLTSADPTAQAIFAAVFGGGTALTVHSGKAAIRAGSTAASPAHGGCLNAGLSLAEDAVTLLGVGLALLAPIMVFALAVFMVIAAVHLAARVRKARPFTRRA